MVIVHLTASTFLGGPERQMLGLAKALAGDCKTVFLSFSEGGRCHEFLNAARQVEFEADALDHDSPHFPAMIRELALRLQDVQADVLCCHGYKAGLLGRVAARRVKVPVVGVSRGWTAENRKVRIYETLDRINLRWMDRVVCVSEGQADKVRRARVAESKVVVIRNAIHTDRFQQPEAGCRAELERLFPQPPRLVVGAAGRLSTEKGFGVLVEAATKVVRADPSVGFVLFGEGALREELTLQIPKAGLADRFVLPGFRGDLDRYFPFFDLFVQSSFTEGLPNVLLEAQAAGVPVVATSVGGTPEVIEDGVTGSLVPAGDAASLAVAVQSVLASETGRNQMGERGRDRMRRLFTFEAQAQQYRKLFAELIEEASAADSIQTSKEVTVAGR